MAKLIIHTNGIRLTREAYRELIRVGVDGFIITKHMRHLPKTVLDILEQEPDANNIFGYRICKPWDYSTVPEL